MRKRMERYEGVGRRKTEGTEVTLVQCYFVATLWLLLVWHVLKDAIFSQMLTTLYPKRH